MGKLTVELEPDEPPTSSRTPTEQPVHDRVISAGPKDKAIVGLLYLESKATRQQVLVF
jgi:hypothetical protein